ncbi:MAG: MarR family transcriptional regulator [Proteobacteria bacterium]|nr:MarR family transcriptional regulator [Pseudomonadota bacterium]
MKNDPNQSLGFIMNDVTRMIRREFDRRAQEIGLTRAQWTVLANLLFRQGLRQNELADILEVQPITLARLLDKLEADGWVERRPDPTDRRAKQLFLTEKVNPVITRMRDIGKGVIAKATDGMPQSEQDQLKAWLLQMRANMCNKSVLKATDNA